MVLVSTTSFSTCTELAVHRESGDLAWAVARPCHALILESLSSAAPDVSFSPG
jgi:hypothetical protein